jgi:hypothetical protein
MMQRSLKRRRHRLAIRLADDRDIRSAVLRLRYRGIDRIVELPLSEGVLTCPRDFGPSFT